MTFTLDLKKAVENIKGDATNTIRGTMFSLSGMIIKGTPVGNPTLWASKPPKGYVGGTLRGSWQASIGQPNRAKTKRKDKDGSATISNVAATITSWDMGETFYLTNPQPYAYRVEYGWSSQRPKGMVRVALMQAQRELDKRT